MRVVVRLRPATKTKAGSGRTRLLCVIVLLPTVFLAMLAGRSGFPLPMRAAELTPMSLSLPGTPPQLSFRFGPAMFPFPADNVSAENDSAAPALRLAEPLALSALAADPLLDAGSIDHSVERFEVVIVHSSLSDVLPETPDLLPDGPVYTVYLPVGDSAEWVMHYTLLPDVVAEPGNVVRIGNSGRVIAPFPVMTFLPPASDNGGRGYKLLAGVLHQDGHLEDLKVVGEAESASDPILSAVRQWRFRPAKQGHRNVSVRVLMEIPRVANAEMPSVTLSP